MVSKQHAKVNNLLVEGCDPQKPTNYITYCKCPCIGHTFFHKIEAKTQGCGSSTDTSAFTVLKILINIHKTS